MSILRLPCRGLLLLVFVTGCGSSNEVEFAENPIAPPPPDAVQGVGSGTPGGNGGVESPGNVATPPPGS